jgi:two-component system, sensor histidine kinase
MTVMDLRTHRFITRWIPQGLEESEQRRAFVFVVSAMMSVVMSLVSVVLAWLSALWALSALNGASLVLSAIALVLFRLVRRRSRVVHFFLGAITVSLAIGALLLDPYELTSVAFLQLVPFAAATLLDSKAAILWLIIVIVVGVSVIVAGEAGFVVHAVDPFPTFSRAMNFCFCVLASLAFVIAFTWERESTHRGMREAERARLASLANIGHDIRTPMNGVLGLTDVLLLDPELPVRHRQMIETIRDSGGVMVSLINDLLDLSKADAGRLLLHNAPLDVRALGNEVRKLWEPMASKQSLRLDVVVGDEMPAALVADGVRVRQVISNLVSNALKFTTEGRVSVRLSASQTRWSVAVEDTGPGLSLEQIDRLFTRFSHAEDHRTRSQEGTGLGLALSRQLCELMGGTLTVQSIPGRGSTFTFELPFTPCSVIALEPQPKGIVQPGLRVLVVDDNAINRLVARRLLESARCEVAEVDDGEQAVQVASRRPFDIILMDLHMPGVDGIEATRQLRALEYAGVIIGVSASAAREDEDHCRSAGMNDFLAKPVRADRLFLKLEQHLRRAA